jgi:D-alanyl-lipoteichoic acid acyltransferase DltB (MBOAT superfamily)
VSAAVHRSIALVQLAGFTSLLYLFRIEDDNLFKIFLVGLCGFMVTTVVRASWRHAVFLATSLVGGCVTAGVLATAVIAVVAGAVVGITRGGARTIWKVCSLLAILAGLAGIMLWKGPLIEDKLGRLFWPTIGSIFAFRAMMCLYDMLHGARRAPITQQLAYFILLPNFALPLFPLIDYRTFVERHALEPTSDDYEHGTRMLLAGFAHLMAYRLVYHYLIIDPEVQLRLIDRVIYVSSFYLLYFRISGLFHVVVGLLCFFGYRLPPTHERHLLSRNFADFWRRTNTYWKDFNQKYVFAPIALVLQRRLSRGSLQVAVFLSLIASWAIHSYQFCALYGRPLLEPRDALFWLVVAFAMVVSTTLDQRKPVRGRLRAKRAPTAREGVVAGVKTVVFFTMMALLWSFWSAPTWSEWKRVVLGMGTS